MKRVGTEPQKKTTTFKKAKPVKFINYLRIIFLEISVLSFEKVHFNSSEITEGENLFGSGYILKND